MLLKVNNQVHKVVQVQEIDAGKVFDGIKVLGMRNEGMNWTFITSHFDVYMGRNGAGMRVEGSREGWYGMCMRVVD